MFFEDYYEIINENDSSKEVQLAGKPITSAIEGTDIYALMNKKIAIGKVKNMILGN